MILNITDYTNPLLVQDDVAIDGLQYFESKFKQLMGFTLKDFKAKAEKHDVDEGYGSEWLWENEGFLYCLSIEAGDPWYKLYKTEITA